MAEITIHYRLGTPDVGRCSNLIRKLGSAVNEFKIKSSHDTVFSSRIFTDEERNQYDVITNMRNRSPIRLQEDLDIYFALAGFPEFVNDSSNYEIVEAVLRNYNKKLAPVRGSAAGRLVINSR